MTGDIEKDQGVGENDDMQWVWWLMLGMGILLLCSFAVILYLLKDKIRSKEQSGVIEEGVNMVPVGNEPGAVNVQKQLSEEGIPDTNIEQNSDLDTLKNEKIEFDDDDDDDIVRELNYTKGGNDIDDDELVNVVNRTADRHNMDADVIQEINKVTIDDCDVIKDLVVTSGGDADDEFGVIGDDDVFTITG